MNNLSQLSVYDAGPDDFDVLKVGF